MIVAMNWLLGASLAFLATAPGGGSVPSGAPLAIVAAVKGHVEVVSSRGGPAAVVAFGKPLLRGDRVVVSPGGSATVFFNDGNVVELGEKSTITVGGRAAVKSRAANGELSGEIYASVNRFVAGGSRETGLVGQTPLRAGASLRPLLVQPRRTNLMNGRPRFQWQPVAGAARYRVTVSGEQGEIWHRDVTDTTLEYPDDAAPLGAGADLAWDVRALSDRDELRREESVVHVMTDAETATVRESLARIQDAAGGAATPAAHFLSGSYLFGQGLYVESAEQFEALLRLAPDSPSPHEALGNVYREVGLADRAAEEYRQALALTR
jgi:hypothetical protein